MNKILAPSAGFEPATAGLEIRCSIQLSYEGKPLRNKAQQYAGDQIYFLVPTTIPSGSVETGYLPCNPSKSTFPGTNHHSGTDDNRRMGITHPLIINPDSTLLHQAPTLPIARYKSAL